MNGRATIGLEFHNRKHAPNICISVLLVLLVLVVEELNTKRNTYLVVVGELTRSQKSHASLRQ